MVVTAKAAIDQERKDIFKEIRHLVSTQHEAPKYLTLADLYLVLATLKGKNDISKQSEGY